MSMSEWMRRSPKGGPRRIPPDPLVQEMAQTVKSHRIQQQYREVMQMGNGPDRTLDRILQPVAEAVGREVAERVAGGASPPSQDETTALFKAHFERMSMAKAIEAMDGNARTGDAEQLSMAAKIWDLSKGLTEHFQRLAETERAQRMAAEEDVGAAASQAKAATDAQWQHMMQLTQEAHARDLAMQERLAKMQVEFERRTADSEAKALATRLDQLLTRFDQEKSALSSAFEREKQKMEADHASALKIEQMRNDYELKLKELEHKRALAEAQTPRGESLDDKWKSHQIDFAVLEKKHELEAKQAEAQAKVEMIGSMTEAVKDATKTLLPAIADLAGLSAKAPVNGVDGRVPPMPEGSGMNLGGGDVGA